MEIITHHTIILKVPTSPHLNVHLVLTVLNPVRGHPDDRCVTLIYKCCSVKYFRMSIKYRSYYSCQNTKRRIYVINQNLQSGTGYILFVHTTTIRLKDFTD